MTCAMGRGEVQKGSRTRGATRKAHHTGITSGVVGPFGYFLTRVTPFMLYRSGKDYQASSS